MALGLASTVFAPWYSSQAFVDHDVYVGNPLPLVDWVVSGLAIGAAIWPPLARFAGALGLLSVLLTILLMWGDGAEGLSVFPGYGLGASTLFALALLWLDAVERKSAAPSSTHTP